MTRSSFLFPTVFAVAATVCANQAFADHHKVGETGDDGFITMFNGEDLTGWRINENPKAWSVEDGAIKSNGDRSHLFYVGTTKNGETAKTLDKPFKDFVFKAQVMTKPNSNAGIYIHTRFQDSGWPAGGFECQVNNSYEKDPRKTASLYAVKDVTEAPAKDNEWFDYEIRVKGDTVTILIDGDKVNEWTQPEDAKPGNDFERVLGAGTFALQAHDPGSTVYFKDLKVKRVE